MSEKSQKELLEFWFGKIENGLSPSGQNKLWYQPNQKTDRLIIEKYQVLHQQAVSGELSSWQQTSQGSLALIILLDQLSRNMYRGRAEAFSFDEKALKYCLEGIEKGFDDEMEVSEQLFYYHPLMHAESLTHQDHLLMLLQKRVKTCSALTRPVVENTIKFAKEHRTIIAEFGRFPYRNEAMNRQSTEVELAYLGGGGKRFGQ